MASAVTGHPQSVDYPAQRRGRRQLAASVPNAPTSVASPNARPSHRHRGELVATHTVTVKLSAA